MHLINRDINIARKRKAFTFVLVNSEVLNTLIIWKKWKSKVEGNAKLYVYIYIHTLYTKINSEWSNYTWLSQWLCTTNFK